MQHLTDRGLAAFYNVSDFNHYYRKHGAGGNAFTVGLSAADFIIRNNNTNVLKLNTHEYRIAS
jgi:hypothetical protein